jgi:hypothetical protein
MQKYEKFLILAINKTLYFSGKIFAHFRKNYYICKLKSYSIYFIDKILKFNKLYDRRS